MAAQISAAEAEEELRRRGVLTGGSQSVLEQPEQATTKEEIKRAVISLLKGSTKGVIDIVGGWGNLYDYVQKSKDPNILSSVGLTNAINKLGGPDLMKIQGYKGLYEVGQAGAPAALMGAVTPAGSLFPNVASRGARAAGEFTVGGGLGLLSQQVAPDSPYAQVAMQSLPYLVKGGIEGLKNRSQQKLLSQYQKDLPDSDLGIFNQYILRGQGSSDPLVAADIARITRSPKYAELITALNEGATKAALEGMAPTAGKLTPEQSKTGIIQAIQNKLDGIRESNANSLFEKAKGYGGQNPLVDPSNTISKIDGLIARYSAQSTPNAERAVQVLQSIRDRLSSTVPVNPEQAALAGAGAPLEMTNKRTIEQVQGVLSEFGKKASAGDNLIKDLSISDERIISSAIFGGMKDDVATALKTATGADKSALNLLNAARDKVSKASQAYNDAIAQGMPAFLHNKTLAEISPEDLYKTYMGLTPTQRGTMRSWVSNTDQAALDVLDQQVYTNFVNQAKKTNPLGVETVDLSTLAKNWRELGNIPGGQDALATALGVKASEFGQRMKDAELFTRKMSVTQQTEQPTIAPGTIRETQAAIGGVVGYSPAKLGQLAMDAFNSLTSKGLSEEQLMKVLLTPEGGKFLKSASLSPRSEKALTDLLSTEQSNLGKFGSWLGATAARTGPRMEATAHPEVPAEQPSAENPATVPAISREDAIKELQSRGIEVPME
jgi:hypothetical protein